MEFRATLAPYCQAAGELGARTGTTTPNPTAAVSHPWWEARHHALHNRCADRARAPVREVWVTGSLGCDPSRKEELYFAKFALAHDASLVIADGPPGQGLKVAQGALDGQGYTTVEDVVYTHLHGDRCARACHLLVAWKGTSDVGPRLLEDLRRTRRTRPLALSSALLPQDAVPQDLYLKEEEGTVAWGVLWSQAATSKSSQAPCSRFSPPGGGGRQTAPNPATT